MTQDLLDHPDPTITNIQLNTVIQPTIEKVNCCTNVCQGNGDIKCNQNCNQAIISGTSGTTQPSGTTKPPDTIVTKKPPDTIVTTQPSGTTQPSDTTSTTQPSSTTQPPDTTSTTQPSSTQPPDLITQIKNYPNISLYIGLAVSFLIIVICLSCLFFLKKR